ncbi:hypothetical protein V8C26DRAFT_433945 [Trichoderma gracile]
MDPYLSPAVLEQLKGPAMHGKPDAEKWKQMYRILFPGEDIPDPYKDELSCNEHVTRLRSAIKCILRKNPNTAQNLLQTMQNIISVAIDAIDGAGGTARDVADFRAAATETLNEPQFLLQWSADMPYSNSGGFFNLSADCPDATSLVGDQVGSGLFAELGNPSAATNDGAGYQIDPWASSALQMFWNRPVLLDDQDAPGTVHEGGQDPDTTGVAWAQNSSEEFPEGGDYAEDQDDAWGDQESS